MFFKGFPKVPRLNRECVVTEKIDGSNAAVVIVPTSAPNFKYGSGEVGIAHHEGEDYAVFAQSRKRLLSPGKSTDNFGFAGWVQEHIADLVQLGDGYHYGEWWGRGINRAYGMVDRQFSLFNVGRWYDGCNGLGKTLTPWCVRVVPVLTTGNFRDAPWENALIQLRNEGSAAAANFDNPEGVVVYHSAAKQLFKVTLDADDAPKGTAT